MRTIALYLVFLTSMIAMPVLMSSCKKCEPYRSHGQMPEETKALIPNKQGDTLFFKDLSGKKFSLVCNAKSVKSVGITNAGHNNECDDSYISWEYLQADYSGNLTFDDGEPMNLMLRLGDTQAFDPAFGSDNCSLRTGRSPLYFKFGSANLAQGTKGFIESNTSPELKNFAFRSSISLNGQQFQDVNLQSIEHPGLETICPAPKIPVFGIDSVYYSINYGLIRLTTVGGKKYQRVL